MKKPTCPVCGVKTGKDDMTARITINGNTDVKVFCEKCAPGVFQCVLKYMTKAALILICAVNPMMAQEPNTNKTIDITDPAEIELYRGLAALGGNGSFTIGAQSVMYDLVRHVGKTNALKAVQLLGWDIAKFDQDEHWVKFLVPYIQKNLLLWFEPSEIKDAPSGYWKTGTNNVYTPYWTFTNSLYFAKDDHAARRRAEGTSIVTNRTEQWVNLMVDLIPKDAEWKNPEPKNRTFGGMKYITETVIETNAFGHMSFEISHTNYFDHLWLVRLPGEFYSVSPKAGEREFRQRLHP